MSSAVASWIFLLFPSRTESGFQCLCVVVEVQLCVASFVRVIWEETPLEMVHLAMADDDGRTVAWRILEDVGAEGNEREETIVMTDGFAEVQGETVRSAVQVVQRLWWVRDFGNSFEFSVRAA